MELQETQRRNALAALPPQTDRAAFVIAARDLGDALMPMAERSTNGAKSYQAADAYQQALSSMPRDADVQDVARLQVRLGKALTLVGMYEPNMVAKRPPIPVLRAAMQAFDAGSLERAAAEAALGAALRELGANEIDRSNLEEAIAHLTSAVANIPKESSPKAWAEAEVDLGLALRVQAFRNLNDDDGMKKSVAAFEGALTVQTADAAPYTHWVTVIEEANSLLLIVASRNQALHMIAEALAHLDRSYSPRAWAQAESTLGYGLRLAGDSSGDPRWYQAAQQAETAALEVVPLGAGDETDRGIAMNRLGTILWRLSDHTKDRAFRDQSIETLREAATIWTRDTGPLQWAQTQYNLASALEILDDEPAYVRDGRLREAMKIIDTVLSVLTPKSDVDLWTVSEYAYGRIAAGRLNAGVGLVEGEIAIKAFNAALTTWTRATSPSNWAQTERDIGLTYAKMAEVGKSATYLTKAIEAYKRAIDGNEELGDRVNAASAVVKLGNALTNLGDWTNDAAPIREAVVNYRKAIAVFDAEQVCAACWGDPSRQMITALSILGNKFADTPSLEAAIVVYAQLMSDEPEPSDYWLAIDRFRTGRMRAVIGQRETGTAALEQAIVEMRSGLVVMTGEDSRLMRAEGMINIADALSLIGERTGERAWTEEAIATYQIAVNEPSLQRAMVSDWEAANEHLGNLKKKVIGQGSSR